jgi:hypothetical protein
MRIGLTGKPAWDCAAVEATIAVTKAINPLTEYSFNTHALPHEIEEQ